MTWKKGHDDDRESQLQLPAVEAVGRRPSRARQARTARPQSASKKTARRIGESGHTHMYVDREPMTTARSLWQAETGGQQADRTSARGRVMYTPHEEPRADEPAQTLMSPSMRKTAAARRRQEDHADCREIGRGRGRPEGGLWSMKTETPMYLVAGGLWRRRRIVTSI